MKKLLAIAVVVMFLSSCEVEYRGETQYHHPRGWERENHPEHHHNEGHDHGYHHDEHGNELQIHL